MEIDILIEDEYQDQIASRDLEKTALGVLEFIRPDGNYQLGIVVTGDGEMRRLNRLYRGIDATTDVLSFAMQDDAVEDDEDKGTNQFPLDLDGMEHLGEVIISLPQALSQSEAVGHSLSREITILVIHGVLHLLGFDHETDEEASVMEKHENDILSRLEGAR